LIKHLTDIKGNAMGLQDSYLSSDNQRTLEDARVDYFNNSIGSPTDKMASLQRFMSRQNCAKFIGQLELFRLTEDVLGGILECGVYFGGGFMTWALIAAALEPYNYQCKVVGFDTFEGAKGLTDVDLRNPHFKRTEGEYYAPSHDDLIQAIELFDRDRALPHLPKAELVKGDIRETCHNYVDQHPEMAVRILHIGMNIYSPTVETLKAFMPRLSAGGVVAIDGLNYATAGCMQALNEIVGNRRLKLRTFDFYPNFTYFVVD